MPMPMPGVHLKMNLIDTGYFGVSLRWKNEEELVTRKMEKNLLSEKIRNLADSIGIDALVMYKWLQT